MTPAEEAVRRCSGQAWARSFGTGLRGKPLQRARPKIKLAFGLFVRGAAEPGRIIDRVGAKGCEGLFFGDPRGRAGARPAREDGEPVALGCRICVNNVVGAGSTFECRSSRCGRILDMHPAPDALAVAYNRNPLLTDLLTHIAITAEPGAWAIEEAVTQREKFDVRRARCRRFHFGIAACAAATAGEASKAKR